MLTKSSSFSFDSFDDKRNKSVQSVVKTKKPDAIRRLHRAKVLSPRIICFMSDLLLSAPGRRFGSRLLCQVRCRPGYLACGSCVTNGFLLSFFETLCCDIVVALCVNIAYAFFDARRESQPPSGVGIS